MPSRRSSSRSAPRQSVAPSNTPLVIFLVFSLLLAITLGVFLYLAQDKIATAKKNEQDANDKAAAAQKLYDAENYKVKKLLAFIDATTLDSKDWDLIRDNDAKGERREPWFEQLRRTMEGGELGKYDPQSGRTEKSLMTAITELRRQLNTTAQNLAATQAQLAAVTGEFNKYKDEWSATVFDRLWKEEKTKLDANIKAKLDELNKTMALKDQKIIDLTKEVEKIFTEAEKKTSDIEKQYTQKSDEEKQKYEELRKEMETKAKASQIIHFDEPRGWVTRTEPNSDTVYLNLGSDRKVRPQLTFSVYGRGPGNKPMSEPKALIEVISVLGRDASLARVTKVAKPAHARAGLDGSMDQYWITDPRQFWRGQNPIVPGDLIYNPVWDPNHKIHVALAGVFDLDGDGSDDVDTVIRLLREHGADVDAYLDPHADYAEKGKIDYQTDFLVIGTMPASVEGTAGVSKAAAAAAARIQEATDRMQKEASKRGVETISFKRFLQRMGYSSLRVPTAKTGTLSGAPAEAAPAAKPEQKEEK